MQQFNNVANEKTYRLEIKFSNRQIKIKMKVEGCTIVEGMSFLSRWKIQLDLKKSLRFISFKGLKGCGDENNFTKI